MLYLLQTSFNPPRGHFQCKAVTNDKKLQWFTYRKIPKRNYIQVACSILINNSLPQVSLIPSFSLSVVSAFFIQLYLNILLNFIMFFNVFLLNIPFLHEDQKMIQLVLDRVWFEFNGKSQSKLMENPSSWNLDLDVHLG